MCNCIDFCKVIYICCISLFAVEGLLYMVSCYRSWSCSVIAICFIFAILRPCSSFVEVTCQTGLWVMGRCSTDLQFPGVLFVFAQDCRPHSLDITVECKTSEV